MGVYSRFKKSPDGFRQLVELLESTPMSRRQKMIDVGMAEDPEYTQKAMEYILTFEDILKLPDGELAEVCNAAQGRTVAMAIAQLPPETKDRFLKCCKPPKAAEIRDFGGTQVQLREIGGAQLKLVEVTRQMEKKGYVKTKRIPTL
jgi:flagellar motor switch protein FliG